MRRRPSLLTILIVAGIIVIFVSILTQQKLPDQKPNLQESGPVKSLIKPEQKNGELHELNNSQQNGKITMKALPGGKTMLTLSVNITTSSAQPAYIYNGTCDNPQFPRMYLLDVKNGESQTIIEQSITELTETPHAVLISKNLNQLKDYTSCSELKR